MGSTILAGEAQDSTAPKAVSVPSRPQGGMAQGPSVLSDLGKASMPALGLCSHWCKGDSLEPQFSDFKALLLPEGHGRMQTPRPAGESLV